MQRNLTAVLFLAAALAAPLAAETVDGYLIDVQCSAKAKQGEEALKSHAKDCLIQCKDSGLGVVDADGKLWRLDDDGAGMAEKIIGLSSRSDNLKVSVTGDASGDTIKVRAVQLI